MFEALAPFLIGIGGSLHCLGMCGPLVVAYSLETAHAVQAAEAGPATLGATLGPQLAFHAGRILTYSILGALAGGFFQAADLGRFSHSHRTYLWVACGVLLVLFGLAILKVLPLPRFLSANSGGTGSFLVNWLRTLVRSPGAASGIKLGMAAALLPCCLSWAMVITAAASQSLTGGLFVMASFGLGTVPALLLAGFSASFLSLRTRMLGERAAALAVIAMGVVLVLKGMGVVV